MSAGTKYMGTVCRAAPFSSASLPDPSSPNGDEDHGVDLQYQPSSVHHASGVMSSTSPTPVFRMQLVHTCSATGSGSDPSAFMNVHNSNDSFLWQESMPAIIL